MVNSCSSDRSKMTKIYLQFHSKLINKLKSKGWSNEKKKKKKKKNDAKPGS